MPHVVLVAGLVHEVEVVGLEAGEETPLPSRLHLTRSRHAVSDFPRGRINILIAHPKSIWVTTLAQQLGQDQPDDHGNTALDRELDRSHKRLAQIAEHPRIDIRTHWAEHANSILRFDDQMLVTLHLHHRPATDTPLLHLQRHTDAGLFDQFASHLDAITQHASDRIQTNPDIDFEPVSEPPAAS